MKTPDFSKIHWHAPGIGEVHSACHKWTILCCVESDKGEDTSDDALAAYVMKALNAYAASQKSDLRQP